MAWDGMGLGWVWAEIRTSWAGQGRVGQGAMRANKWRCGAVRVLLRCGAVRCDAAWCGVVQSGWRGWDRMGWDRVEQSSG